MPGSPEASDAGYGPARERRMPKANPLPAQSSARGERHPTTAEPAVRGPEHAGSVHRTAAAGAAEAGPYPRRPHPGGVTRDGTAGAFLGPVASVRAGAVAAA